MNYELLNAILAMDSYNRGYGEGLAGLGGIGSRIGNAVISNQSSTLVGGEAVTSGFYAISYNYNGEKIIAYRGTDEKFVWPWDDTDGSDVWNGYTVAAGNVGAKQAKLAFEFYQTVAGEGVDPRSADISLTGHSLGGGLAGLVAAVYHKMGILFNNMSFEAAAEEAYDLSTGSGANTDLKQLIYGNATPWDISLYGLKTWETEGDFLDFVRGLQQTPQYELKFGPNVNLPGYEFTIGIGHPLIGYIFELEVYGMPHHSISTQAMLLYAENIIDDDWKTASKHFWPILYDDDFAESIGFNSDTLSGRMKTDKDYSGILRTVLAYSALEADQDGNGLIFGDTGIHALYDDANDLGKALGQNNISGLLNATADMVSKSFVQYASQLAMKNVTHASHAEALDGILSLSEDSGALTLDFSEDIWSLGRQEAQELIIGRELLLNSLKGEFSITQNFSWDWAIRFTSDIGWWARTREGGIVIDAVKGIILATKDTGVEISINEEIDETDAHTLQEVTYIFAGQGNDTIHGTNGSDVIWGGNGDDHIYGSSGADLLIGGNGIDSYYIDGNFDLENSYDVVTIEDTGISDKIYIGGIQLQGNIQTILDDRYYIGSHRIELWNDAIAIVNGSPKIWINNWENGDYGIYMPGWPTVMHGTENNDTLMGNAENNVLKGAGGNDTLTGGTGSDSFYFVRKAGAIDVITDFDAADEIIDLTDASFTGIHEISALTIADNNGDAVLGFGNNQILRLQGVDYTTLTDANFSFSPWTNETLNGSEGDDVITTGGGYDRLYGMGGNDTLDGGAAHDVLYGDDGSFNAVGGNDVLIGGNGYDQLYGEGGNDTLDSGADADQLYGGAGNDIITGGADSDTFFFIQETNATDTITDFEIGIDYIDLNDISLGAIENIDDLNITDDNGIAVLQLGNGHVLCLEGVDYTTLSNDNFQFFINYITDYNGNETLNGTQYKDYISAYAGNTILNGFDGNDYLTVQTGNNTLVGGLGNDTLYGGFDNGVDMFIFEKDNDSTDTISRFFLGQDKLDLTANSLNAIQFNDLLLSDDNGTAIIGLGNGQTIRLNGIDYTTLTATDFLFAAPINASPVAIPDTYTLDEGTTLTVAAIEGVLANDTDGDEDALSAILVDDVAYGTLTLNADGSFSYTHNGSENFTDSFSYKVNDGTVDGNTVTVSFTIHPVIPAGELIYGTAGNDTIYGTAGNDTIYGVSGRDVIYGDSGDDWIQPGVNPDTVDGGEGIDTVDYSYVNGVVRIDMVNGMLIGTEHVFTNFENAVSTAFNDEIIGNALDNMLTSGAGDDTLYGGAGNDTLIGEAGNDLFIFDNATGHDVIADYVDGEDVIRLADMPGASSFAEAMTFANQIGNDVVFNFGINSTVTVRNMTLAQFNAADFEFGHDSITGTAGADSLSGGYGNDTMNGLGGNDTLRGGTGHDSIYGGANNDWLFGEGGDDRLFGQANNDYLIGAAGNDTLNGGAGNDVFVFTHVSAHDVVQDFTHGQDKMRFTDLEGANSFTEAMSTATQVGSDVVFTINTELSITLRNKVLAQFTAADFDFGHDSITGTNGNDVLQGQYGNDTISALAGNDTVYAGTGNDTVYGQAGHDIIYGENGNDYLQGNGGNDTIYGGNGNDVIVGGDGVDHLYGEAGADIFLFSALSHSTQATRDTIYDFTQGEDKIMLANIGFTSIGTAAASGDTLSFVHHSGNTVIVDDGTFRILLSGEFNLTDQDFIFA